MLPLLDLFKVDSKEALLLTGEEDPERAVRAVHALGPRLVLLTHQGGVCVFDGTIPLHAARSPAGRSRAGPVAATPAPPRSSPAAGAA